MATQMNRATCINSRFDPKMSDEERNRTMKDCFKDSVKTARPPPKVIEFVEPRRQRKEGKIVASLSDKRKKSNSHGNRRPASDETDFNSIAREVRKFGMTGKSLKERKEYQQRKAQALGAKAPKRIKVPYPVLMDRIKKRKEEENLQREMEHAMGIFEKKKTNKRRTSSTRIPSRQWVDKSHQGVLFSVGKYKAGVQRLSKADIRKVQLSKI